MKKACSLLLLLLCSGLALAQGTRLWKEAGYDDFERGTVKGIAIRSSGVLELAPAFKVVYTSPSTFIWSIAADKDGVVYAATGAPARVYRITPDGKSAVIFEPKRRRNGNGRDDHHQRSRNFRREPPQAGAQRH